MSQMAKRRAIDAIDLPVRKRQMYSTTADVKTENIETKDERRTDEPNSRLAERNVDDAHGAEQRIQGQQDNFQRLIQKDIASPQSTPIPRRSKEDSIRLLEAEMEVVELEQEVKRLTSKLLRQQRIHDQTKLRLGNELAQKERIQISVQGSQVRRDLDRIPILESEISYLTRDCVRHRNSINSLKFQIMGLSKDRVKQQANLEHERQRRAQLEQELDDLRRQHSTNSVPADPHAPLNARSDQENEELSLQRTKIQQLESAARVDGSRLQALQDLTDRKDQEVQRLQLQVSKRQEQRDHLAGQLKQAEHEIEKLAKSRERLQEKFSTIEVDKSPAQDAHRTEIKILRTHNNELARDKHRLEERVREMRTQFVDLEVDLDTQKRLCTASTRKEQEMKTEVEVARSALSTLSKKTVEDSGIIKQLLKTKLSLETQLRQRGTAIKSLEETALEKTPQKCGSTCKVAKRDTRRAQKKAEVRIEKLKEHYDSVQTKNTILVGKLTAMAQAGGFGSRGNFYRKELDSLKAPSLDELEALLHSD